MEQTASSHSQMGSSQENDGERQVREYYRVDEEGCSFGTVSAKGDYREKSNFSIKLQTYVDCENAGYFAWVKRKSDGQQKLCFYTTESLVLKQNFLREIRVTFGAGGFVCAFSEKELAEFHQHLEKHFPFQDPSRVKKGLVCAGRQPGSNVWVLNKHLYINENGSQIPETECMYAWQPIGGPCIQVTGKSTSLSGIDLQSDIQLPLLSCEPDVPDPNPVKNLLALMQVVFKHNFIPSVLSVAAAIMALHYEVIIKTYDACPIPMLVGESETGKSSAVRCALSLCGQEDTGHLMKSKSTSDTVCMERCCKSTLPFSLDDPKTVEGVGELLIDLCNGRVVGNMKVGLRKPRSIPLMCCNFTMGTLRRYSSRALIIPFGTPSIGPTTEAEGRAFGLLAEAQREASSAVGWAIRQGKEFATDGVAAVSSRLLPAVRSRLIGVDPRLCTGYACLLYFAEKVVTKARMMVLQDELQEFLDEILPQLQTSGVQAPSGCLSEHLNVVASILLEAAQWAEHHLNEGNLHKVLRTMRTETSYQGKSAVAICLDDLAGNLSYSPMAIRKAVKDGQLGRHNVSKDFVPESSTNTNLSRDSNSRSRKSTVIWLGKLPAHIKGKLQEVTSQNPGHMGTSRSTSTAVTSPPSTTTTVTSPPFTSTAVTSPPSTTTTVTSPPSTTTAVTSPPSTTTTMTSPPSTSTAVTSPPSTSTAVTSPPSTSTAVTSQPSTSTAVTSPPSTSTTIAAGVNPRRGRKRKTPYPQTAPQPRRQTRQNSAALPAWSRNINSNNPLGL